MDVSQNLLQFKMQLLRHMPFYGDILMRLPIRESKDVPTAATDGRVILYNANYFSRLAPGEQNFVIMHEVFHVLLQHARRAAGSVRDHQLWNTACDLIINNMLINQLNHPMRMYGIPFSMPEGGLYRYMSASTTAENLYARLQKDNACNPTLQKVLLMPDWVGTGQPKPTEYAPAADLLPESGSAQGQQADDQLLKGILRSAMSSHQDAASRGDSSYYVPAACYDLYAVKPLNWRKLLFNMLDHQISDDSSYATPERKYLHMDLILPGHTTSEEVLGEVWLFVDSSGSIPTQTMSAFLTQVHHILKSFPCTMNIAYWDTAVTDVYRKIRKEKELQSCLPHHSGGTNINCVYRWIRENKIRPDAMVILTDGYYGNLQETEVAQRLRRRTILLLSTDIATDDDMKKIGKIARLTE